jgi:hypothetical protein
MGVLIALATISFIFLRLFLFQLFGKRGQHMARHIKKEATHRPERCAEDTAATAILLVLCRCLMHWFRRGSKERRDEVRCTVYIGRGRIYELQVAIPGLAWTMFYNVHIRSAIGRDGQVERRAGLFATRHAVREHKAG